MEPVGCGARGRRRGLAGLRGDAPSHTQRHKRRRCGGRRRARRARARFETTRPATHSDTSAAGMEGADRTRGLRCQAAGPVGGGRAWPGFETTHPATHSDTSAAGVEGAGGSGGPGRASRSTTPSRRLACGDLAGGRARRHPEHQRRPEHHQHPAARTLRRMRTRHSGITKTARPHWGRAAVAVALGFEPRVAVTPHSISSAAPSAARTRYLTRILYYTDPRSVQIDRAGWDQGHTTSQDHTAARNMGATSAYRTVENKIK